MESKYIAVIIVILTFVILIGYGFYWVGTLADADITAKVLKEMDEKIEDPKLKYEEEKFVFYLDLLEDCLDGKIQVEKTKEPLPVFRQVLFEIGFKSLICDEEEVTKIKDGCIDILEIISGEENGDDIKAWDDWFDAQEPKK
jgi:hypothetical protein